MTAAHPVPFGQRHQESLADVLERVLDKGVVIAGDIVVNVLDLELLSLKLRLFVASAQTARELGMDWWATDPFFSSRARGPVDGGTPDGAGTGNAVTALPACLSAAGQASRDPDGALLDGDLASSVTGTAGYAELARENEELRRQVRELQQAVLGRPAPPGEAGPRETAR